MKKAILSLTIAIAALGVMTASAVNQCPQDPANCPNSALKAANKMYQPREFTEFAMEGILLEPAQQARMDSLNAAVKAAQCDKPKKCPGCDENCQCQADKNCDKANCPKANCDKANCPKAKCDSAKCDKAPKCDKPGKGHHGFKGMGPKCPAACPEYMAKVKEILTPDQYVVFLENVVKYQAEQPKGMGGRHGMGPNKFQPKRDGDAQCGNGDGNCENACPKAKAAKANNDKKSKKAK